MRVSWRTRRQCGGTLLACPQMAKAGTWCGNVVCKEYELTGCGQWDCVVWKWADVGMGKWGNGGMNAEV